MISLAFLSPGRAADAAGLHPVARSPMERRQRDAGAVFEERDGWLVPVSIPGEAEHLRTAAIGDLSHLGKIEVRTDRTSGWTPADTGRSHSYRISPRRTLVLCPTAETGRLLEEIARQPQCKLALDVTAALGILAIAGPERWTVVRRLTHLHEAGSSGEVAHVNSVHLLEIDATVWLVFPQEFGHYLWEVAVDRAVPLGGGPAGIDAILGKHA